MIQEEGPGWRIAWDSSRKSFPFLLGGEKWSVEISEEEFSSLILLINDLSNERLKLTNQLMPEESLSLELERFPWWVCIDGFKGSWSLHLILEERSRRTRGFEAFWPSSSAIAITTAMRNMWDSYNH